MTTSSKSGSKPTPSRATRAASKTVTPTNKTGSSSSKAASSKDISSKMASTETPMDVDEEEMELTERTFAYEGVLDRMVETFVNAKTYTIFKKLSGVSPADVLLSETPFVGLSQCS